MSSIMTVVRGLPRTWLRIGVVALIVAATAGSVGGYRLAHSTPHTTTFPQSATIEDELGVRFSRIAVVGDGGLITLTYVVLDSEKASRFQADTAHRPVLHSESRNRATNRVSLMKQGHTLRAGQTYYLVYENTRGALHPGERATIIVGALGLEHVPVL